MAERLRSDAWQAIKATDTMTRNRQHSNTRRLGEFYIEVEVEISFIHPGCNYIILGHVLPTLHLDKSSSMRKTKVNYFRITL